MDQITHQVRLANWTKIIEQCSNRPQGTTIKQWLMENGINEKSYYYWLRRVRQNAYSRMDIELPAVTTPAEQPAVAFAEIPVPERTNASFKADAMISTGSFVIGISNSISVKGLMVLPSLSVQNMI